MYCDMNISIWNVMRYDGYDQDGLERNGLQHGNKPLNMMGANESY